MKTFRIKTKDQQRRENGGIEYATWCHGSMDVFEGKLYTENGPGFVSYDQYGGLTLRDGFGCQWWFAPELYEATDMIFATHLAGNLTLGPGINLSSESFETIATKTADMVVDRLRTERFNKLENDRESSKRIPYQSFEEDKEPDEWCQPEPEKLRKINTHNQSSTKASYDYGCNIDIRPLKENPQFSCIENDSPISLKVKEKDAVALKSLPSKRTDVPIVLKNIE